MAAGALHIWPRGNFMLIALPNDGRQLHRDAVSAKHGAAELRHVDRDRRNRRVLRARIFRTPRT